MTIQPGLILEVTRQPMEIATYHPMTLLQNLNWIQRKAITFFYSLSQNIISASAKQILHQL